MDRSKIRACIRELSLSPFEAHKPKLDLSAFTTRDAKRIARAALRSFSFSLPATAKLLELFPYTTDLLNRQTYVSSIEERDRSFLASLAAPKGAFRTPFTYTAATASEAVYREAIARKVPCVLITNPADLEELSGYELVLHDLDHDLPNGVEGDLFLFDHLRMLAKWKDSLDIPLDSARELRSLLGLLNAEGASAASIESRFAELESRFSERLDALTLSGSALVKAMSGTLPLEVSSILQELVSGTGLEGLIDEKLPLALDREAVRERLEADQQNAAVAYAERAIRAGAHTIPERIARLEEELLLLDFEQALFEASSDHMPVRGSLRFSSIENPLLADPQPVGFELESARASILTGANSGGKTTLLELLITIHVYASLGLGFSGPIALPGYTRIAYYAKNSGSANRGAFETLLHELSRIKADEHTLILADEIEAVTEPGVAGVIIAESVAHFLEEGASLVIATHLGREIEPVLPKGARIDGIEAKGLTDAFELEVDHQPVIGRLARSTPELIIRRLAQREGGAYYERLARSLDR